MQKETGDMCRFYCCSYFFLTGNDLGIMGVFFQKFVIELTVSAEIPGSLKFGILGRY